MTTRNYSSVTPLTTLSSGITPSDTTITVASAGPWPAPPFTLILGYDTVDEEVVEVTAASGGGNVFTVTRGVDGTTAKSHSAGSQAVHGVSAREFSEANAHANATTSVHGIADTAALETTTGAQAKADAAEAAAAAYTDSSVAGIDLSGYVANSLISSSKGSLITSTGSAVDDLAVGSNGQVLVADSGETVGLKWAGQSEVIGVACSDETTDLEAGTGVVTFRMPFAMTLTAVRASVTTAPVGANIQVDINEDGSTILGTILSIDDGEKTSTTAATAAVISDSALADDAEITIDIDQVGSTTAGAGLKVWLIGTKA